MIECHKVTKKFGHPEQEILHGLSFKIDEGEFVSISGKSGSGKSTLLYLISSLDSPSSGTVLIDGRDLNSYDVEEIHQFRNKKTGFIFQFHYLLPELTALENVLLPARNLGLNDKLRPNALELLDRLGVKRQHNRLPSELSGGEQQRIAIARALILKPKFLFADEPTGNLDSINANIVMEILKEVNRVDHTTICLVTHDPGFAAMAEREIYLIDGRLAQRSEER